MLSFFNVFILLLVVIVVIVVLLAVSVAAILAVEPHHLLDGRRVLGRLIIIVRVIVIVLLVILGLVNHHWGLGHLSLCIVTVAVLSGFRIIIFVLVFLGNRWLHLIISERFMSCALHHHLGLNWDHLILHRFLLFELSKGPLNAFFVLVLEVCPLYGARTLDVDGVEDLADILIR